MNKKTLSERDICTQYITPAIAAAQWNTELEMREEVRLYVVNERVQYCGPDGRLITESLRDYTRIQIGKRFASLDDFLKTWNDADRKAAVIAELENQCFLFEEPAKETGKTLDPFHLVCHIAFGGKPAYLGAIRELEQRLYQQAAT